MPSYVAFTCILVIHCLTIGNQDPDHKNLNSKIKSIDGVSDHKSPEAHCVQSKSVLQPQPEIPQPVNSLLDLLRYATMTIYGEVECVCVCVCVCVPIPFLNSGP